MAHHTTSFLNLIVRAIIEDLEAELDRKADDDTVELQPVSGLDPWMKYNENRC